MKLRVIGTGSKGNCYILETDGELYMFDCGISEKDVLRAIDFNINAVKAVFVTHKHKDHAYSVKNLAKRFMRIIGPPTVTDADYKPLRKYRIGDMRFMPFEVPHDDELNYGYFIELPNGETFLYATDYSYIPYIFNRPINHFLIECNFTLTDVEHDAEKYGHVIRGHAALNTVVSYLHGSVCETTRNIILCHASYFSNKNRMRQTVQREFPSVNVYVAHKGDEYEI